MAEIRHLEIDMTSFFAEGGPIWIKFRRLVQNDMSTVVMWSKSKPGVEFQYNGRFGEFNGMSSQSHLPHCRVLPPGEFNVMILELRITLQSAATWWIHCHDSTATCHIARCSHLAKSMSWFLSYVSHCRVLPLGEFTVTIPEPHATLQGAVTWRNQCHDRATLHGVRIPSAILKIVFLHILLFLFLMQFRLWWAAAFVSSPIHLFA